MLLRFENVTKNINDHGRIIEALKPASFQLEAGEFIAIVGPSGSGKTTILSLMGALQRPSSGKIYLNDKLFSEMTDLELEKLRFTDVGFILQESNLLPYLNLLDQLRLVDKIKGIPFQKDKAIALLERCGLGNHLTSFPDDLSGGERQRAALCRAVYPDPAIVLADEPTANLDSELAFSVIELLRDSCRERGKTVVMVTHDERLLTYVDRVFELIDGNLKERCLN